GLLTPALRLLVVPVDLVLEALAADEPHGVAGAAAAVGDQAEDGDDAGVVEAGGDLGLGEEPAAAGRVVGESGLDQLEGDVAVQLGVAGGVHLAEPALGVQGADGEPADDV